MFNKQFHVSDLPGNFLLQHNLPTNNHVFISATISGDPIRLYSFRFSEDWTSSGYWTASSTEEHRSNYVTMVTAARISQCAAEGSGQRVEVTLLMTYWRSWCCVICAVNATQGHMSRPYASNLFLSASNGVYVRVEMRKWFQCYVVSSEAGLPMDSRMQEPKSARLLGWRTLNDKLKRLYLGTHI